MKRHLLCLTVDTDPDGLSGKHTDRQALEWGGLDHLQRLPEQLQAHAELRAIPITWFIRADGQLESILGDAAFLLGRFDHFWAAVQRANHELAWHPHLYRHAKREDTASIITDPKEVQDELERLWEELRQDFPAISFRNGEGWHTPSTYATVEKMGFQCDSTAIPGRRGVHAHPMDWARAPNRPYFPRFGDLCAEGPERRLLELPMNTWFVKAPYDNAPKLRYINPAVHPHLFREALQNWEDTREITSNELSVSVMIFHPDEVFARAGEDYLYSRSLGSLLANLAALQEALQREEIDLEWVTVAKAAELWRQSRMRQSA